MSRIMKTAAAISLAVTVITAVLFICFNKGIFLTLAISFGTTAYHLCMRLLVGLIYNIGMKNRADYTKEWYRIHPWENKLYKLLNVKAWKDKMPTYNPSSFSNKEHTWDEIAQAMCQSELVHETNIILSFLPITAVKWFGSFWVFLITSLFGALFDLIFVIMQRYNRTRVIKIALRQRQSLHK